MFAAAVTAFMTMRPRGMMYIHCKAGSSQSDSDTTTFQVVHTTKKKSNNIQVIFITVLTYLAQKDFSGGFITSPSPLSVSINCSTNDGVLQVHNLVRTRNQVSFERG